MDDVKVLQALNTKYEQLAEAASNNSPLDINLNEKYIVFNEQDKRYYRSRVDKQCKNGTYKVYLLDYGISIKLTKYKFYNIDPEDLALPPAAKHCGIHGIKPVEAAWSSDASSLLREITKNDALRVLVMQHQSLDSFWHIDLITLDSTNPVSVQEAFIYTGMAKMQAGTSANSKRLAPSVQRICKESVYENEVHAVKMLHIKDPLEFYVIKEKNLAVKADVQEKLNKDFEQNDQQLAHQVIYAAPLKTGCACNLQNKWQRASIEEVLGHGNIRIYLVDVGSHELVHWRQLCVLPKSYLKINELALKCSLVDIEPLQCNNYTWTPEAQREFRQLVAQPRLQIDVRECTHYEYKVVLHISKRNLTINVGSELVRAGHAVSTGEFSTPIETAAKRSNDAIMKMQHDLTCCDSAAFTTMDSSKAAGVEKDKRNLKKIKRTAVDIVHVVNPGEFYIQLQTLRAGIRIFHQEIQAELSGEANAATEHGGGTYELEDRCFVFAKFQPFHSRKALTSAASTASRWYRGIVVGISEHSEPDSISYYVHLRDIGATVSQIKPSQLRRIPAKWDNVANAVTRCHLACLKPTAGMPNWSNSAVDYFRHQLNSYAGITVTMQAQRDPVTQSVPVIVWGTINKELNPLAPTLTQYVNMNRLLVMHGLAHLAERLDFTNDMQKWVEIEAEESQITLDEWIKKTETNSTIKAVNKIVQASEGKQNPNDDNTVIMADDISATYKELLEDLPDEQTTDATKVPSCWLTTFPIENTQFSGYPSYVDYNCNICIQTHEHRQLIGKMCQLLENKYGALSCDCEYTLGQACIVRFHLDKKLYRGIVVKLAAADPLYSVQFVDFGNTEECEAHELLPYAPFARLPALCSKFKLRGIRPLLGEHKFSTVTLDYIHKMIVDKLVLVSINYDKLGTAVIPCNIRVDGYDVSERLVKDNYALSKFDTKHKHMSGLRWNPVNMDTTPSDRNDTGSYSAHSLDDDDNQAALNNNLLMDMSLLPEQQQTVKNSVFNLNDYMAMHQFDDNSDILVESVVEEPEDEAMSLPIENKGSIYGEIFMDEVNYDDADIVELEHTFSMNWYNDEGIENEDVPMPIEIEERRKTKTPPSTAASKQSKKNRNVALQDHNTLSFFNPNHTSTTITHFSGLSVLKPNHLPCGVDHFECHVAAVISPTVIHIFPHLKDFDIRYQTLNRDIKYEVERKNPPLLKEFKPHTICLARWLRDKQWYRAIIRFYNPQTNLADVLYLDYLNAETLPVNELRECPPNLINNWPARTIKARLLDIKPNPNIETDRIKMALSQLLKKNSVVFARVKQHVTQPEHLICIDDDGNCNYDYANENDDMIGITLHKNATEETSIYEKLIERGLYLRN